MGAGVNAAMTVLAGISWEPEIRGALVVLVGSLVLFGSVWLILTTNLGNRLGSLNALAGFFGWMFIMGAVWWIYGIGYLGDPAAWEPREIVSGDIAEGITGDVSALGDATLADAPGLIETYCPGLVDATVAVQRDRVVQEDLGLELIAGGYYTPPADRPYCGEELGELLAVDVETIAEEQTARNDLLAADDSRRLDSAELEESIATIVDDERRKDDQLTLSSLKAVAPELVDEATADGVLSFNGWTLFSSAEAGEAAATAGAFLAESTDDPFETAADFIVLDTFQKGGKPKKDSSGVWDRVSNEIRNTVVFWHPTNTVVVQVAPTLDKPTVVGAAPPFPEIDPDGQIVSVVMIRNLGNKRLPAALIAIGSLIVFLGLCWMLHVRDRELTRRTAEWDPATAGV